MNWYIGLALIWALACSVAFSHGEFVSDKMKSASFASAMFGAVAIVIGCTVGADYDQYWWIDGAIALITGFVIAGLSVWWNAKFELGQHSRSYSKLV